MNIEMLITKMSVIIILLNVFLPLLLKQFGFRPNCGLSFCGLVGYSGEVPADPKIIKLLLLYNMDRGEDSTGWIVNNEIKKDTEKVSKFLAANKLVISPDDVNYSIICHARKTSSGTKFNKDLAHPFGMYKDSVEKDRYDLVLAMNGTLDYINEFCEEFGQEYKPGTNSDTQMLARIMCQLGEKDYVKALERYTGVATLLFMSPKYPNTLMAYKDIQRPLFYWQKSKNEIYISSMKEALESVSDSSEDIFSFEDSKLVRINKGKITKTISIDRSNTVKFKTFTPKKSYSSAPRVNEFITNEEKELTNVGKGSHDNRKIHANKGARIYLYCDKYFNNGHPITGKKYISKVGEISDTLKEGYDEMFFFFGYICKSEEAYNEITAKVGIVVKGNQEVDTTKFRVTKISDMCEYFKYPVSSYISENMTNFRYILNDEWAEKLKNSKTKGKLEIDFFLSNAIISISDTGKKTKLTGKVVCEEYLVQLKSSLIAKGSSALTKTAGVNTVLESIKSRFSEAQCKNEIIRRMKAEGETAWPTTIYRSMKIDYWNANNSSDLDDYYYGLIFDLFRAAGVADNATLDRIFSIGEKDFSGNEFINEVKTLQNLYIKFLNTIGKSSINPEEPVEEKSLSLSSTIGFHEGITVASEIQSIKKSNEIYCNNSFKREFYDGNYPTLTEFSEMYVSSDAQESEKIAFYEAVMLSLNHVGKITNKEASEFLDDPTNSEILSSLRSKYAEFVSYIKGSSSSVSSTVDDDQSELEGMQEKFDAESLEKDVLNAFLDILNQMNENIDLIDVMCEDNVPTKKTIELRNIMFNSVDAMKRSAGLTPATKK